MTAVATTAFTAAQFNQYVRDNLNETAPAKAASAGGFIVTSGANSVIQRTPGSDTINTAQTTTSTTFVDLGPGPTVSSVASGSRVMVWFTAQMNNSGANNESIAAIEVSGATSTAADDNISVTTQSASALSDITCCRAIRFTVTPGTNTYTMKYRVSAGTGSFRRRSIVALPF